MSEKIDPLGVFGESLGAASGANRFRQPALSPGERTLALEEQMCVLESRLSEIGRAHV